MNSPATTSAVQPDVQLDVPPDVRGADMVFIPGGTFRMGSDKHYREEAPVHRVKVDDFWIDRRPVTNRDFAQFVDATGYITIAEIAPRAEDYPGALPEMLQPASLVFTPPKHRVPLNDWRQWWAFCFGADWRHPYGPGSSLAGREDHPVVHVAFADVQAYAAWAGKELATEAQWEYAARGGLDGAVYAWGDEFIPGGKFMANTWHGEFPHANSKADGFARTSPVGSFPPNGYGLVDMIGNTWEWTQDFYTPGHAADAAKPCCIPANPRNASDAQSFDPNQPEVRIPRRVLKGGSHLCAPSYCVRYRPAARHAQQVDSGATHIGFRCVVNISGRVGETSA